MSRVISVEWRGQIWRAVGQDEAGRRVKGFSTYDRQEAIHRCLTFSQRSTNSAPYKRVARPESGN